jgi:hypothetical protein
VPLAVRAVSVKAMVDGVSALGVKNLVAVPAAATGLGDAFAAPFSCTSL